MLMLLNQGRNTMKNENTHLTTEQEKAVIDTNKVIANLEPLIEEVTTIKVLNGLGKLLTVTSLVKIKNLKESKAYIGMLYINEEGNSSKVKTWSEFCKYKLKVGMATIDKSILNLRELGEEALEACHRMGLGDRELRKLRHIEPEQRTVLINSKEFDLGDKDAVKDKIEEMSFQYNTKLAEKQKELDDEKQNTAVTREMLSDEQKKNNDMKEQAAQRRFAQGSLGENAYGCAFGMVEAGISITQGINQLKDIFETITDDDNEMDQKTQKYMIQSFRAKVKQCSDSFDEEIRDFISILTPLGCSDTDEQICTAEDLLLNNGVMPQEE